MDSEKENNENTFDFDTEFTKGLTLEEAKAESIKRIREWWGKDYKLQKIRKDLITFNFGTEFAKGLSPEEFKAEMSKRIKAYPWKK